MESTTEAETDPLIGSWAATEAEPRPHVYETIDAIEWTQFGEMIVLRYMSMCGRSFISQDPGPTNGASRKRCPYCEDLVGGRQLKLL